MRVQPSMDFDGLFSRADALASGMSDGQLLRARRRGEVLTIRPGAYVTSEHFGTLDSEQQHLMLARAIALDSPVVLSHQSAAIAWGIDVWGLPLAQVHTTNGRSITARSSRRWRVHGTALDPDEHTSRDGVGLTTPARTVVDIARSTDFQHAVCVGDSALRRGLVTIGELQESVVRAKHRTGVQNAVDAVAAMTDRSDSVGETRSRLILVDAGFVPLLNQSVYDDGGAFLGRVDFLLGPPPVVLEFDGVGKYGASAVEIRATALAEKYREDRIRAVGYPFARWGWDDLSRPAVIVDRVRRALELASRTPAPTGCIRNNPMPR